MTKKPETALHNIAVADLNYTPDRRDMGDLKALATGKALDMAAVDEALPFY